MRLLAGLLLLPIHNRTCQPKRHLPPLAPLWWQEVTTKRGRASKVSPAAQTAAHEILRTIYQICDFKRMDKFTEAMHQKDKRGNPRQQGAMWEAKLATRTSVHLARNAACVESHDHKPTEKGKIPSRSSVTHTRAARTASTTSE